MTTDFVVYATTTHGSAYSPRARSPGTAWLCWYLCSGLHKVENQGVSWAGFLTGGSPGEEPGLFDCRTEAPISLTGGPLHLRANRHTECISRLESLISLLLPTEKISAFQGLCDYVDHLENSLRSADKKP